MLESPILPRGRVRPPLLPGPLHGGGSLECQVRGGFTHSIKEAWSRPRRNVAPGFRGPLTLAGEPLGSFITSRLFPETTPCLRLRGTAWLPMGGIKWVGLPPPPPGFTSVDTAFPGGPLTGSRVCPCALCTASQRGKRPGLHRVPVPLPSIPAPGSPFLQDCPPHGSDTRLPTRRKARDGGIRETL